MQSAEPARSILKTPTTPLTRKRVMFQEESSDTDASAVDILVIDVSFLPMPFEVHIGTLYNI